jgi:hypothetical protein
MGQAQHSSHFLFWASAVLHSISFWELAFLQYVTILNLSPVTIHLLIQFCLDRGLVRAQIHPRKSNIVGFPAQKK